jgi:hypothetical protein
MPGRVPRSEPISLLSVRARARAPRVLAIATMALLCVAGARSLLAPRSVPAAAIRIQCTGDVEAEGFAETFVRSWLSWGTSAQSTARALATRDSDIAITAPPGASRRIRWTAPVADECAGEGRRRIVVAAAADTELSHVAVSVSRSPRGLIVSGAPAIVGPPRIDPNALTAPETEIADRTLEEVVTRVLRHYLRRDGADLDADLAPGARISLPDAPLSVTAVDVVTWVRPGRTVAVSATARTADGARLPLRYELSVARSAGRWLVARIESNTNDPEVHR